MKETQLKINFRWMQLNMVLLLYLIIQTNKRIDFWFGIVLRISENLETLLELLR